MPLTELLYAVRTSATANVELRSADHRKCAAPGKGGIAVRQQQVPRYRTSAPYTPGYTSNKGEEYQLTAF